MRKIVIVSNKQLIQQQNLDELFSERKILQLVYQLSYALFKDGYAIKQRWI